MLNFLRKLRRNNMNGKYLRYAIGEIFLVMVGILLALGINNWNVKKKARAFERKMLEEVSFALEEDIRSFTYYDSMITSWEASMVYLLDKMEINNPASNNLDSMQYHLQIIYDIGFFNIYNDGPFEAIKSSGLEMISDHETRSSLADLYSKDLPGLTIWINELTRRHLWKKYDLMGEIFEFKVENSDLTQSVLVLSDFDFLKSKKLKTTIRELLNIISRTKIIITRNNERMQHLFELIEFNLKG